MRNLLALAAVTLAACAGPTTTVRSVDTRPALAVVGAPSGTLLFVDGAQVGDARAYEGQPDVLRCWGQLGWPGGSRNCPA